MICPFTRKAVNFDEWTMGLWQGTASRLFCVVTDGYIFILFCGHDFR